MAVQFQSVGAAALDSGAAIILACPLLLCFFNRGSAAAPASVK
jgi:hypothetical protein